MTERPNRTDALGDRLMGMMFWWKPTRDVGELTRRRITVHLIPVLFCLYILAYLDRVNVSVAQLDMIEPVKAGGLGFTNEIIGFGAGLFFWGYWILEIPSTISVAHWGARWVFCRILVLWGICATLVGFIGHPFGDLLFVWLPQIPETWIDPGTTVIGPAVSYYNSLPTNLASQFYFLRFMLGFFEGGFFPSVIVYLSYWYCAKDRAKAIASFMAAIPLSSALGLPLSGLLLKVNWFGLEGWRWIFILEGLAPVVAGFLVLFCLPDFPKKVKWLTDEERTWLLDELEREHRSKQSHHWAWVHHLGMVLLLTGVYFCLNVTSYGLGMFMPAIIKSQLDTESNMLATLLATLPYVVALFAMLINGWHSDRTGERVWHVAIPLALTSVALWLAVATDNVPYLPVVLMIVLVGPVLYSHLPAFWPMPTMFLGATAAASAIGFINMMGNLGGYYGPTIVGKAADGPPVELFSGIQVSPFAYGLLKLSPWPILAAAVVVVVGYMRAKTAPPVEKAQTVVAGEPVIACDTPRTESPAAGKKA